MSRKTTPAEQKYHSYELEVLVIVEALKKWRVFVLVSKFKIITDCNAFTTTLQKTRRTLTRSPMGYVSSGI